MAEVVWDEGQWVPRRAAHHARIDAWLAGHVERRGRGIRHPVEDFLFEYYNFRPSQLRRWHPGSGVTLTGSAADELLSWPHYRRLETGVGVDTASLVGARRDSIGWVHDLLVATASRPAFYGCFGLHEWAMVYRAPGEQRRHPDWPLRMGPEQVADVVQDRGLRCGHFDAFRFFTPPARPLNVVQPTRATQHQLEQPGCLHANMDLYKHAYKLSPLVDSDLVADAFALARDIRTLDMRASPYDLSALDLEPVPIETQQGRADYAREQRAFTSRAAPIRAALITATTRLLAVSGD